MRCSIEGGYNSSFGFRETEEPNAISIGLENHNTTSDLSISMECFWIGIFVCGVFLLYICICKHSHTHILLTGFTNGWALSDPPLCDAIRDWFYIEHWASVSVNWIAINYMYTIRIITTEFNRRQRTIYMLANVCVATYESLSRWNRIEVLNDAHWLLTEKNFELHCGFAVTLYQSGKTTIKWK